MSSETRPELHLIVEAKAVRPVMGHFRSRYAAHFPAKVPVRPQKVSPNPFGSRILPVSPTPSSACLKNPAMCMKMRNFLGGGWGT